MAKYIATEKVRLEMMLDVLPFFVMIAMIPLGVMVAVMMATRSYKSSLPIIGLLALQILSVGMICIILERPPALRFLFHDASNDWLMGCLYFSMWAFVLMLIILSGYRFRANAVVGLTGVITSVVFSFAAFIVYIEGYAT